MNLLHFANILKQYGLDVLLLAAAVCFLTELLKKTLLKNLQKKLITFIPFVLGIVLFGLYWLITRGAQYTAQNLASVLEYGFSCGCIATLYYVAYEQFVRSNPAKSSFVGSILSGYVGNDKLAAASAEVLSLLSEGKPTVAELADVISRYVENASRAEAELYASLIIAAFDKLNGNLS